MTAAWALLVVALVLDAVGWWLVLRGPVDEIVSPAMFTVAFGLVVASMVVR